MKVRLWPAAVPPEASKVAESVTGVEVVAEVLEALTETLVATARARFKVTVPEKAVFFESVPETVRV